MKFSFKEKFAEGSSIPKLAGITGLIAILLLLLVNMMDVRFIQDDAYTSFRYAKNFVEGNGLVFNVGERVEGYTNFLWVMILSLIYFLDHIRLINVELENAAQFLSVLFTVTFIILTYTLSRKIIIRECREKFSYRNFIIELIALIPVFLLSVSSPLIYWGVSAMETTLFASLTLLSILLYLNKMEKDKPDGWLISTLVLNTLLRPEGLVIFALVYSHKLYIAFSRSEEREITLKIRSSFSKTNLKELLYFTIPLLIYLGFRLVYFGYPLPNTFYAKTEFSLLFISRGFNYFVEFARAYLLFGFMLLFPLILLFDKNNVKEFSFLIWFTFAWTALNILIGGDVLPIHRFFLPLMPLMFILFVRAVQYSAEYFQKVNKLIPYLLLTALVAAALAGGTLNYRLQKPEMMEKRSYESGLVHKMKVYASWVKSQREKSGSQTSIAMSTIGAFSFYSDARVIDLVGLTDEFTAHNPKEVEGIDEELPVLWKERRYNAEYVLSRKPDYIIFPAGAKPSAFAECALYVQNEFRKNYFMQLFYSDQLHQLLPIFTRREQIGIETADLKCDNKYLKHFIEANNYFLNMIEKNDRSILQKILTACDSAAALCPQRMSDLNTLKGMAFYHTGNMQIAQSYLIKAAGESDANSIARYYLMKIYNSRKEEREVVRLIGEIILYSPDAFPNLVK